jgi:hypothetical protein
LDELKEKRGYWKFKYEALDCTLWGTRSGRVCGRVVRQNTVQIALLYFSKYFLSCMCGLVMCSCPTDYIDVLLRCRAAG